MSGSKRQNLKRGDLPAPVTGGAGQPLATATATPEQARPTAPAPFGLQLLTSGYERSGPSPSAYAQLDWFASPGTPASASWELEWSRASDFSQTPVKKSTTKPGEVRGLVPGTTYVRVRAVVAGLPGLWSAALAVTISPLSDAPPPPPTGLTATWSPITGNLEIRCTRPAGEQVQGVRFRIYTAAGGTLLRTVDTPAGQYVWEREQQRVDRGGALPLPAAASCFIIANAVSWAGNLSSDLTLAATLPAPAAVTGLTTSWAGDAGTAGPTCRVSFTGTAAVPFYDATIDGVAQPGVAGQVSGTLAYDYDLARNAADHSGTPDPVLAISVRGRDALGQLGPAATTTATNAAPPVTTITVFSGRFLIALTIGASAAADIKDYRVRVYRDGGGPVKTFFVSSLKPTYTPEDGSGAYTFDIAARDLFGQVGAASAQTAGVDLIDPAQFVADLRAGLIYTDSAGTAQSVLAGLKDGDLTSNVVTYGASATWGHTTADWQEEITAQITELALSAPASVYLGYSIDGVTWTWVYGGTPAAGRWTPPSSTTTEATAQAGAVTLAAGTWRIKLATPRRARFIRLARRNTSASYALREFFPASLVRATYIEAENLAAIAADLGTVTAGTVIGVTMIGNTIQTNTTPTRVELSGDALQVFNGGVQRVRIDTAGLKTFDSLGNVQVEATTATDGALRAGGGAVTLDKTGETLYAPEGASWLEASEANIKIRRASTAALMGVIGARYYADVGLTQVLFTARAQVSGGLPPQFDFSTYDFAGTRQALIISDGGIEASGVSTFNSDTFFNGGVRVGSGSPPSAGQIATSGPVGVRMAPTNNGHGLQAAGPGTTAATYNLATYNGVGAALFSINDAGNAYLVGALTQGSDRRLKADITPIHGARRVVQRLAGLARTYTRGGRRESGFVAQDIQAIPELAHLVSAGEDGILSLNYLGLIAWLAAALGEV